jgi:hypothetical protein
MPDQEYNRVFHKVRKTQHPNPEFVPKSGETKTKTAKKYIKLRNAPLFVPN